MSSSLWSYPELTAALGLPRADGPSVGGVSIDSRRTKPGDLFVALPGDPGPRFQATARSDRDGHDYVGHAVANGAVAVLVNRPVEVAAPQLQVADTMDGLWDLGRAARARLDAPVVAVTGSSGKTTFKSFAATAIGAFATDGSLNNHIGVPLSLARTPRDAAAAVYEIGTNHPGEIEPLAKLARPDVAVLLNVHPAHIENFGSLEAIEREKTTIALGLTDGTFVCPPAIARNAERPTITFAEAPGADVHLLGVSGDRVRLSTPFGNIEAPVPGGGPHRAMSVCALAAVLCALDMPLARLDRLAGEGLPRGRGNRVVAADVTVIDESYNANPASMAATLAAFAQAPGRRVAILGDMLELGADTRRYHADLADRCGDLDGVFCVGSDIRALYDRLRPSQRLGFGERADAAFAGQCADALRPGDRVLVKGSNSVFWARGFVETLVQALRGAR